MRDPDFKKDLMKIADEVSELLVENGKKYGDDMLNLFKEQYPLMHCIAKCLRVKNLIQVHISSRETNETDVNIELLNTIDEESRDILGYAMLLVAIERGLIK